MADPARSSSRYPTDRFGLSRPVWLLGWVSFFNDVATELVYPLLPLFLTRVLGTGAMSLGIIEGVAEAANSVLKLVSGWLADRSRAPSRLVLAGYALSAAVRPLVGLVTSWPQVLALRFGDRVGKGVRGAPRDAMLAAFADPRLRGRVFSFNNAMDHAGAVLGPLIASAFLYFVPDGFRTLFLLTLVPGLIVILILLRVPDPEPRRDDGNEARADARRERDGLSRQGNRDASLPRAFYAAIAVIFLFSLGNASDAFLLLRLSDLGIAPVWIPLLWSGLHVVKVTSSVVGGELSDRFGRRSLIALGWLWYAAVYAGFGLVDGRAAIVPIFLSYGVYFGLTEGVEKAWVTDLTPRTKQGTAFGIYNAVLGIGSLAASLLFGVIWSRVSPPAAFLTGAGLALAASIALWFVQSPAGTDDRAAHN